MQRQFIRLSLMGIILISMVFGAVVSADTGTVTDMGTVQQSADTSQPVHGHLVWTSTTGNTVSSSPAVSDGVLYIGSEDGTLYAFNTASGAIIWKYQTGSYISSSPKISDGTVYFGGGDRMLYALDADSGSVAWTYRTGAGISSSPAISNGIVYVGSEDGTLYALNAGSGIPLWNYTTANYVHSSPAVANGIVYFGSYDTNVYALNATTGTRIWNYTTGNTVLSSPAVAGGRVYIGSYDHNVYALNAVSGTEIWRFTTGNTVLSSPTVAGGSVYIGSSDGNIYALDAGSGAMVWSYKTGGEVDSTPLVADGIVYAGSGDGNVYALNATDGHPAWLYPAGNYVYSSPAIANNIIYVGSYDHNVYALSNLPPVVDFTADKTSGTTPVIVHFTDESTGSPTAWLWDFGDGKNSVDQNPVHTYLDSGTFTVNITVTNGGGSVSRERAGYVTTTTILPPAPVANFTVDRLIGKVPFTVHFTDLSSISSTAWLWDFGDGNTSTRESPAYTYVQPGNYTVTLIASNSGGSSSLTLATPITVHANVIVPDPDFTVNTTSGIEPLAVQFTDASSGPDITGRTWDFNGDGIIDSTDQDPVCVYKLPGNYTVNLSVTNPFGTKTMTKKEFVTVGSLAPVASFAANSTTGNPALTVQFTDTSTGSNITGWAWDFNNDSIIDSTDQNPSCVYKLPGNYTVSLTATNVFGSTTISKKDFVIVNSLAPVVNFTSNVRTGIAPLSVQFTDTSVGSNITGWAWDFNTDGIIDSTDQNPVCVYTKPGNYTVNLTVTNAVGTRTTSKEGFVTVTNGVVADFTANNLTGIAPLSVQFRDASAGPNITGWAWDFNTDGVIDSTDQNPVCVYTMPGNYTVNLTVTNALGTNSTSRQGFILVRDRAPVAGFTADNTTGIPPLAVQFTDTSVGANITGRAWDFNGDGIIDSTDQNPSCVYNLPGNYTINLTVTNAFGSNMTSKKGFITLTNGVPRARFAVNRTSGFAPLAVQFKDTSIGANITGRTWDFNGDGIIDSTEQNPFCVYNLPGNYTINLTVANAYGTNVTIRKGFITVT